LLFKMYEISIFILNFLIILKGILF
jgi:hypothetical protein